MEQDRITRDGFIFYRSFQDAIKGLSKEDQADAYSAIITYGLEGVILEDITPVAKAIFIMAKPQVDANNRRYLNGLKGGEHGKKGGRPKKITPKKPQDNPKKTPKEKDKVKEKEKENVKAKDEREILKEKHKVTDEFIDVIFNWFQYKKEMGQAYKADGARTAFINKLKEYSGGNATVAQKIIEQSMANNWKGIFELKNKPNKQQYNDKPQKTFRRIG